MHDAADSVRRPMFLEQRHRIVPSLARMNDNRLARRRRNRHLFDERGFLRLARREIVVVVQAYLANGDHLSMREQLGNEAEISWSSLRRIVRVDPNRRIERRILVRQSNTGLEIGRAIAGTDSDHVFHSGRERPFDHLIAIGVKLRAVQVTVGVDQAHFNRAPIGMSSRKPASTGLPPSTDAATIMPLDSMPRSLRGWRFATITTLRPINCSGVYASAIPATKVRGSASAMSTFKCSSLSAPLTRSADSTRPTRISTLAKSSMLILESGCTGTCGAAPCAA